jgi:hypothetical protein
MLFFRELLARARSRPRSWLALAVLCACGPDSVPGNPPGGFELPDGSVLDDAALPGDGDVAHDGSTDAPPLTLCEEATLHSDLAWLEANVFVPSCATVGCHTGANPSVGLWLDAGRVYNNLVDKPSSTKPGWVRVVPGSIAQSYLMVAFGRVDGPEPRSGFMPLGTEPLCTEIHEAIERWIAAGAPP